MDNYDVIVIGGGAAGLMAAGQAAHAHLDGLAGRTVLHRVVEEVQQGLTKGDAVHVGHQARAAVKLLRRMQMTVLPQ